MRAEDIRSKFDTARYQFTIATDMGSYLSMVNEDDPFLKWRVDWYLAWRDGRYTPKAKLRTYLRDAVKADFLTVYEPGTPARWHQFLQVLQQVSETIEPSIAERSAVAWFDALIQFADDLCMQCTLAEETLVDY